MAFKSTVWSLGKLLLLGGALVATFLIFAAGAMRVAIRTLEVTVPDLTGQSINEASEVLIAQGLTLRVEETRRLDPKIPAGRIMSQEPAAGLTARRQRSVKVWVSGGARVNIVPALIGGSDRTAQQELQRDGFEISGLAEIRSNDYPTETVIAQEPPAKSTGTRVSLLINRGEQGATFVMPDLIGVVGDRAAEMLRLRGFRVALVGDHPYPGVPPGIVLRQHPQAGFQIGPGEPISLEVSR